MRFASPGLPDKQQRLRPTGLCRRQERIEVPSRGDVNIDSVGRVDRPKALSKYDRIEKSAPKGKSDRLTPRLTRHTASLAALRSRKVNDMPVMASVVYPRLGQI